MSSNSTLNKPESNVTFSQFNIEKDELKEVFFMNLISHIYSVFFI